MRNKISCSAERLGLLTSEMIQAVSDASAFQIAHQYLTTNRVRIAEADDSQIMSSVVGKSGLYEQTIRLKDGHLVSKCSCTLPEEPMCRHCIAVLLEYQRWAQPRQLRNPKHAKESIPAAPISPSDNGKKATLPPFTADVKLSDVMVFLERADRTAGRRSHDAVGRAGVVAELVKSALDRSDGAGIHALTGLLLRETGSGRRWGRRDQCCGRCRRRSRLRFVGAAGSQAGDDGGGCRAHRRESGHAALRAVPVRLCGKRMDTDVPLPR